MVKIWTNPGEVKGLGPRQCNRDDVMKKKIANCTLLSMHDHHPLYGARWNKSASHRAACTPPLTQGMEMDGGGETMCVFFSTQNENDSTAFTSRRCDHIKRVLNNKKNGTNQWRDHPGAPAPTVCPVRTLFSLRNNTLLALLSFIMRLREGLIFPVRRRFRVEFLACLMLICFFWRGFCHCRISEG